METRKYSPYKIYLPVLVLIGVAFSLLWFTGISPLFISAGLTLTFLAFTLYLGPRMFRVEKQLNEHLENEHLFRDLLDAQPAGIYRLVQIKNTPAHPDALPELYYQFLNIQHEYITGINNRDLLENPQLIATMIHDEDLNSFVDTNYRAVKNRSLFNWEGRIVKNGETRWLRIDSTPRLLRNGNVLWTGIIIDVSKYKMLEQEMERHKDFERILNELSSHFVNIKIENFDRFIQKALQRVGEYYSTDRVYIFLLDDNQEFAHNTHEWCAPGISSQKSYLQNLEYAKVPLWMQTLKNFKPLNIYKVEEMDKDWEVEKRILQQQQIKSVVSVPIISHEKLIGFVGFDSVKEHRLWKEYEVKMLKVFADLIYNALQRKEAEVQLLESRRMLRSVLDTIQVRVFWKDLNRQYMGCNQYFAGDAGKENPSALIGLSDAMLPWKEQAEAQAQLERQVSDSGLVLENLEEQRTLADGKLHWVKSTCIPLRNAAGRIIGVLGTYEIITARKQAKEKLKASEQKYRILTENAFDGIYLLRNKRFEYVNPRFCEITGYSPEELMQPDFDIYNMFTQQGRELVESRRAARSRNEEIPGIYEVELVSKDKKTKDVEISTNPLYTPDGFIIMGIMRDISERKHNEALRNQVAIANQTVIFKQNFLANMSHEIRTPLTGVMGMIEILSKTSLDVNQQDYLNTLRYSAGNLREIINQILDYSKIEAGQVQLKPKAFKSSAIFDNARKLYSSICTKEIILETRIDPSLPEYMRTDQNRLTQIINNLVSNAVKFTLKGKITLEATLEKRVGEKEFEVKVIVTDTGVGISPESMKKLFQPFEQIEMEDTRHFDGTGLGLSISKELSRLMGGDIWVSSTPGKGSTFWFTFVAEDTCSKAAMKESDKGKLVASSKNLSLKILFAEDKIVNQKVITLMLREMGHHVSIVQNGKEAVDAFLPGYYDLILMDIQMPEMDGITATRNLKEKFTNLPPVVGLSANAFEGDREKYMKLGMDEYLTKPVSYEDFENIINKLFNHLGQ